MAWPRPSSSSTPAPCRGPSLGKQVPFWPQVLPHGSPSSHPDTATLTYWLKGESPAAPGPAGLPWGRSGGQGSPWPANGLKLGSSSLSQSRL